MQPPNCATSARPWSKSYSDRSTRTQPTLLRRSWRRNRWCGCRDWGPCSQGSTFRLHFFENANAIIRLPGSSEGHSNVCACPPVLTPVGVVADDVHGLCKTSGRLKRREAGNGSTRLSGTPYHMSESRRPSRRGPTATWRFYSWLKTLNRNKKWWQKCSRTQQDSLSKGQSDQWSV